MKEASHNMESAVEGPWFLGFGIRTFRVICDTFDLNNNAQDYDLDSTPWSSIIRTPKSPSSMLWSTHPCRHRAVTDDSECYMKAVPNDGSVWYYRAHPCSPAGQ